MRLYKCSECGKEVLPKGLKEMITKAYGSEFYDRVYSNKYCNCKEPDIAESKRQFEKENKVIAETIKEVVNNYG